jgi:glutaredoxin
MIPIVYTLEVCPNCIKLKEALTKAGIRYDERDMQSAESITEMRVNGCFAMEAPVLQVGEIFAESSTLFEQGTVDMQYVRQMIDDEDNSNKVY